MTRALLGGLLLMAACGGDADQGAAEPMLEEAPPVARNEIHEKTVLSDVYHIDAKYRSMVGPWSQIDVYLVDEPEPEQLWITGYESIVVDAAGTEHLSQEFMCHANLDFDVQPYYETFGAERGLSGRVFTLSQGQEKVEFPEGFGIPILSTMPLRLTTQVLNLNIDDPDLDVRHKVTVSFVRESEVVTPMKPLYQAAVQGFKALDESGTYYGRDEVTEEDHGPGCEVGTPAIDGDVDFDVHGQRFTAHWVVPPGREVARTLVTDFFGLQHDTTAHYIAVHMHPFGESLELVDRTTGETVYKAAVDNAEGRVGIESVDHYSSAEGIKVYADHEYELISVYDNTSGEDVDSMAVLYFYLLDPTYQKPDLSKVSALAPTSAPEVPADGAPPGMGM